ncbi:MAG TPA: hypothetical protein VHB21_05720, partial [Minicystis sp.]|nr:hypothetical protein [Minicystis sp.]
HEALRYGLGERLMAELFDRVVEASELSGIFARGTLSRALRRAGAEPETLSRSTLSAALPEIRRAIAPFVERRIDEVMGNIERLTR